MLLNPPTPGVPSRVGITYVVAISPLLLGRSMDLLVLDEKVLANFLVLFTMAGLRSESV